jgi:hypothetical protein
LLLYSTTIKKPGVLRIAPIRPAGEARQILRHSTEDGCPVDQVEGIAKIQAKDDFVRLAKVAVHPVPRHMNTTFKVARHSDPDLQGPDLASVFTAWHKSFPTSRRRLSPTAVGRTPPEGFGKACNDAPARCGAREAGASAGASPRAIRLLN